MSSLSMTTSNASTERNPSPIQAFQNMLERLSLSSAASEHSNNSNDTHSNSGSEHSEKLVGDIPVEYEEIITLTNLCKEFRDRLASLKKIFHPDAGKRSETPRVQGHERLGDILKTMQQVFERYPTLQANDVLIAATVMIQRVKDYPFEEENNNLTEVFEGISQLASAFSGRVSEYLMGDIDTNPTASKTRASRENLIDCAVNTISPAECDERFLACDEGMDVALDRAKAASKYAKDIMAYIAKRVQYEEEHARNLMKLSQSTRRLLREEGFLPFQSIYHSALKQDFTASSDTMSTNALILSHKFLEPLNARCVEHDRVRKAIKHDWQHETKRMNDAIHNLKKAKTNYLTRQAEYERAKSGGRRSRDSTSGLAAEQTSAIEQGKSDKKRRAEEECCLRAMEAENHYRACVQASNDRAAALRRVKKDLLVQIRELICQCDQTMKAVTVSYFQQLHTLSAPLPVHYQTLCEASKLYEPGSKYTLFAQERLGSVDESHQTVPMYTFHSFADRFTADNLQVASCSKVRLSDSDSAESTEDLCDDRRSPNSATTGRSATSSELLETEAQVDSGFFGTSPIGASKAKKDLLAIAKSKKMKLPKRCSHCDTKAFTNGVECAECGRSVSNSSLEDGDSSVDYCEFTDSAFGLPLRTLCRNATDQIHYFVYKCVKLVEKEHINLSGIYRVSGAVAQVKILYEQLGGPGGVHLDISKYPGHVVTTALKRFIRQWPVPLLYFPGKWLEMAHNHQGDITMDHLSDAVRKNIVIELRTLAFQLPEAHYNTASFLLSHLQLVAKHHETNQMTANNLALLFAPGLLHVDENFVSLAELLAVNYDASKVPVLMLAIRAIELLIIFADCVFSPKRYQPNMTVCVSLDQVDGPSTSTDAKHITQSTIAIETRDSSHRAETVFSARNRASVVNELRRQFLSDQQRSPADEDRGQGLSMLSSALIPTRPHTLNHPKLKKTVSANEV